MDKPLKVLAVICIFILVILSFIVLVPLAIVGYLLKFINAVHQEILSQTDYLLNYVGAQDGEEK